MPLRILLLGPIPAETREALERLAGGGTILSTAESHDALNRIAADQPDLVVEGAHALDWAGSAAQFRSILEGEFARSVRYRHPLSMVIVGVDGGEALAATHGHDALDRFSRALADGLRRSLRQIDVLARTQADEIVIVLPETSAAGARIVAERARVLASKLIVKSGPELHPKALPLKASVSVGVCDIPAEDIASADEFLSKARAARRSAQTQGGGRVAPASA